MRKNILIALGLVIFLFAIGIVSAININTCEFNVNETGTYYLTQNISLPETMGDCLNVSSSNVIIDCAGYAINKTHLGDSIILREVSNVTITNCTIIDVPAGSAIELSNSSNVDITNCNFIRVNYGIYGGSGAIGDGSHHNTISHNSFQDIFLDGIQLAEGSRNNTIKNNTFHNISQYGIFILGSSGAEGTGGNNTLIVNNTISNCTIGILLEYCVHVNITGNVIENISNFTDGLNPDTAGIALLDSELSYIYDNNLSNNKNGTVLINSNNSIIYHNNFVDNTQSAWDNGSNNNWNTTESGNYWSDWDTAGEGCSDANSDGICDAAYTVSGSAGSKDNFPYTSISGWLSTTSTGDILAPTVTLNTANNTVFGSTLINLNCTAWDDRKIENVSLYGNWSSSEWHLNQTNSTSITNNSLVSFSVNVSEGSFIWNCYACDNSSNCSFADNNFTLNVDTTVPAVNLESPADDSKVNKSSSTMFKYNVSDVSNITKCTLYIDNTSYSTDNSIAKDKSQNITYTISSGNFTWHINCTDAAGNTNISSRYNLEVIYDVTPPVVTSVFTLANGSTMSSNTWYNQNISMNLSAADAGIGLDSLMYRNGTSGAWTTYSTAVNFTTNITNNKVQFRANDTLGNTGGYTTTAIKIDNTVPSVGTPSLSSNQMAKGDTFTIETDTSDALSGLFNITAVLNNTAYELSLYDGKYSGSLTAPAAEGIYNVTVNTTDYAGNTNDSVKIEITVNNSIPTISPNWANNSYIKNNTPITFVFGNITSGNYTLSNTSVYAGAGTSRFAELYRSYGIGISYYDGDYRRAPCYQMGDTEDWIYTYRTTDVRSFLSFNISDITSITSAALYLTEYVCLGDNSMGKLPQDIGTGILEHTTFDYVVPVRWYSYWYPQDYTDEINEFYSTTALNTVATIYGAGDVSCEENRLQTVDVTDYVNTDIAAGRNYSQYRLRYTNAGDSDDLLDYMLFKSYGKANKWQPHIALLYGNTTFTESSKTWTFLQPSVDIKNFTVNITVTGPGGHVIKKDYTYFFDNINPNLTITAPGDGATVNGTVTITANVTDDIGIDKINILINTSTEIEIINKSPYQYKWDTIQTNDTSYLITIEAFDYAGNVNSSNITLIVDNSAPITKNIVNGVADFGGTQIENYISQIINLNSTTAIITVTKNPVTNSIPSNMNTTLLSLNISADTATNSTIYFKIPTVRLTQSEIDRGIYVFMDHDEDGTYEENTTATYLRQVENDYEFYFITSSFSVFSIGTVSVSAGDGGNGGTTTGGGGSGGSRKQCNDNIDNDNDGLIDYPNDPGCQNILDNDETDIACKQEWDCTGWSECIDEKQTRICTETSNCEYKFKIREYASIMEVPRPAEERDCIFGETEDEKEIKEKIEGVLDMLTSKNKIFMALPLIAIIAILFYIGYVKYMHLKRANPEGASAEIKRLFAPHVKKLMPEIKNPVKKTKLQAKKQVKPVQKRIIKSPGKTFPKIQETVPKQVKPVQKITEKQKQVKETIPKPENILKQKKKPKKPKPAFSSYKEFQNTP